MQIIQKKKKNEKLVCLIEKLNLYDHWLYAFSTSENGALILYFKKVILKIQCQSKKSSLSKQSQL